MEGRPWSFSVCLKNALSGYFSLVVGGSHISFRKSECWREARRQNRMKFRQVSEAQNYDHLNNMLEGTGDTNRVLSVRTDVIQSKCG